MLASTSSLAANFSRPVTHVSTNNFARCDSKRVDKRRLDSLRAHLDLSRGQLVAVGDARVPHGLVARLLDSAAVGPVQQGQRHAELRRNVLLVVPPLLQFCSFFF